MTTLNSIMKVTSVVNFILLSSMLTSTTAITDTMKACVSAQEVLFENVELDEAFKSMLIGFNLTCHDENLCQYDMDEATKDSLSPVNGAPPSPKDILKVKGTGNAHFGGSFQEHASYDTYRTACDDAGGSVACVDAHVTLLGNAGGAFMKDADGIETDVKIVVTAFPMCMVQECEKEDVTKILENTGKNAILKSDQVQEDLDSQMESMIKAATTEQVCALSGLDTCEITVVSRGSCKAAQSEELNGVLKGVHNGAQSGPGNKVTAAASLVGVVAFAGLAVFARRMYKRKTGGDIEMQTP